MGTTRAPHPAKAYQASIDRLKKRGRAATIALAAGAVFHLCSAVLDGAWSWQFHRAQKGAELPESTAGLYEASFGITGIVELALIIVTAVLFLRWFHRITALTRILGDRPFRWTARNAVTSFLLPFINFVRPYQIACDIRRRLEPEALPEPPVRTIVDETSGYRATRTKAPPPPVHLPPMWLSAWWWLFIGRGLFASGASRLGAETLAELETFTKINAVSALLDALAAFFAIMVVRGLTARLLERYRRVRYNSPAVLEEAGIVLPVAE